MVTVRILDDDSACGDIRVADLLEPEPFASKHFSPRRGET
jgi:hypothetical protein